MKKVVGIILGILIVVAVGLGALYYFKPESEIIEKIKPILPVEKPRLQVIDEDSKSRPFAIMINNLAKARPLHSGLQDAYILYELMVEGGITRYLALFKDKDTERVGSIRSCRHYYLDYALENDAIYVHWGSSPQGRKDISALKVNTIEGGGKYFFRDNNLIVDGKKYSVNSEHTGFSTLPKLKEGLEAKKYRKELNKPLLLNYSVKNVDNSNIESKEDAKHVDVTFSKVITSNFEYNVDKKLYEMSVNKKAHVDYVTKEQYTYKNIIVYSVRYFPIPGGGKGRQDIDNIGTGTGYFITEGYAYPINWEKKSRSDATKYYLDNGKEIVVNDGNTYIGIIPTNGTIKIESGGNDGESS